MISNYINQMNPTIIIKNNSSFPPVLQQELSQTTIYFKGSVKWKSENLEDYLFMVEECGAKQLTCTNKFMKASCFQNIFGIMSGINFPSLRFLTVTYSKIESIENLVKVQMNSLEKLYIGNNEITTIRILRKNSFYNLEILSLMNNKIEDGADLAHIQSSSVYQLIIDEMNTQKCQMHCLSHVLKIKAESFKNIYERGKRRIKQISMNRVLEKKYPKIHIYKQMV